MNKTSDLELIIAQAVATFWDTKDKQLSLSAEVSNRGAVTGGKQLDGFLTMLRNAGISAGVPARCIYTKNNYLPGYFRSSKDWDFLIISPSGKLLVAIELKSQVGSYSNNFNNRAEEAIGTATDFWKAYREKEFPTFGQPWIGYVMLIGDDHGSTSPVRNHINHYPVLPEFDNASYIDRYKILCDKLMTERLYTAACLIATKNKDTFRNVSPELSIQRFIQSLRGYLTGCESEFN